MDERHVLLIDDSEAFLEHARSALEPNGFRVSATSEPIGAGRFLKEGTLVLIDYHMPGVDGAFVVSSLRSAASLAGLKDCAFYLHTSDTNEAQRFDSHGFDGAIVEKGELDRLVTQVSAVFRSMLLRSLRPKGEEN